MKPERLVRRWERRQADLLADLRVQLRAARSKGEAEAVHQLRVALRRLRLSMRLAKPALVEERTGRFRAWAARISRATSRVRDLDIAVDWLRGCNASLAVVQDCETRRNRLWRRNRRLVTPPPRGLLPALARLPGGRRTEAGLARRLRKLESSYAEALRRQVPRFFQLSEEARHEFRRTVRWWRYLRELVLPRKRLKKDALWQGLLAAQEALGNTQNLALVQADLEELPPSTELTELKSMLARQREAQAFAATQGLATLKSALE